MADNGKRKDYTHRSGGHRIKGNQKLIKASFGHWLNQDLFLGDRFVRFRNTMKDWIALRFQHVFIMFKMLSVILGIEKCLKIIESYLEEGVYSFISCLIKYFNNSKPHIASIDDKLFDCNSSCRQKAAQHARQDCLGCSDFLEDIKKSKYTKTDKICKEIERAKKGINFIANYFYALIEGELPEIISSTIHEKIKHDKAVSRLYVFDEVIGSFTLKRKAFYRNLELTTATELFCIMFKYYI